MTENDPLEVLYVDNPATLVGRTAPDFTGEAVMGDGSLGKITLSDNWKEGRFTLLFFYPFDFTFVCPTEILAFDQKLEEFRKRNCSVVGVSIDSKFVHKAWRDTPTDEGGIGPIRYPLVADVTHEIADQYGVLHPTVGAAFRGLFLIDTNGTVRHCVINDLPLGRSVDEALRMVDALQFHEQHGEVCPADWKPGEDSIDPDHAANYFKKHGKRTVTVTQ